MAAQPRQRRSPADHTGAQRDKLEKEHAEELARRAEELGMATAAAQAANDEVVDYTSQSDGVREVGAEEMGLVAADGAVVVGGEEPVIVDSDRGVEIRINTDLDEVTIGAGNNYSFKEGQRVRVPAHVAAHLEEKGYVWH